MSPERLLAFGMLTVVAGCAAQDPREPSQRLGAAIIDGQASGANDDSVVLIRSMLSDYAEVLCSASLVAPNLLLTARHCVSYFHDGLFSCSVQGELINNGDGAGQLGLHFPASGIEVYAGPVPRSEPVAHGQQVISTLSEGVCLNDLAFVVLDTALDLPLAPLRLGRPAEVGEGAVLVGFGLDGDEGELGYRTQPRRRRPGLSIAGVGPDSLADGVTTVPPRTLILEGPSGCVGDSGGPLVDEVSGAVLGVYSLQDGDSCVLPQVRHLLVHVPPFELLIEQAFAAAGAEPLRESPRDEGGAAGSGSEPSAAEGGTHGGGEPTQVGEASRSSGCSFAPDEDGRLEQLLALGALATTLQRIGRRRRCGSLRSRRLGRSRQCRGWSLWREWPSGNRF